ncbi:hypothetical protein [Methyloglobulus sp.]|uniref:hypothetical protein n=1 Tax=Methyloglobulus sp. TaxID=2518622 RepID=UPI0032B71E6F
MEIMSMVRGLCLLPIIIVYGAWLLCQFTLGLIMLLLVAWLIHTLFGIAGDVVLALPVIYVLSYLLPNPRFGDIANTFNFKIKANGNDKVLPKAQVVDFKAYRRGTKP